MPFKHWLLNHLTRIAPERFARRAIERVRQQAGLRRRMLILDDGLEYVFLEGGQGDPLLLLHGFGSNKDNFARIAAHLAPHYRLIIPDHIGFGESSKPAEADYSPRAQAERLHRLVQALGLGRVHLGGSSMGGHIAMTYAALRPAEVDSLWLLDPGGVWSVPRQPVWNRLSETGRNPLMVESTEDLARVFGLVMARPPFIPRPVLEILAGPRIANQAIERRAFEHIGKDPVEARIEGLSVPTLIVWGEDDQVISVVAGERLHALIPGSRFIRLPGIGHLPMLECPRRCAQDYLAFRASLVDTARNAAAAVALQ